MTHSPETTYSKADFGSRQRHIVSTFQIYKAMVLLCAMSLATGVASVLRQSAKTAAELRDLSEAVEVINYSPYIRILHTIYMYGDISQTTTR